MGMCLRDVEGDVVNSANERRCSECQCDELCVVAMHGVDDDRRKLVGARCCAIFSRCEIEPYC